MIASGKEGGRRGCRTVNSSTRGTVPLASSPGSDPPATAERVRVAASMHSTSCFFFRPSIAAADLRSSEQRAARSLVVQFLQELL